MDNQIADLAIKAHLREIRERLDNAASIARAAEACSEAGNVDKAVDIANDNEQSIYEVTTLLNAAESDQSPPRHLTQTQLALAPRQRPSASAGLWWWRRIPSRHNRNRSATWSRKPRSSNRNQQRAPR